MSACSTVPASTTVFTSYSTSTVTGQQVSTIPGSTSTATSAVVYTTCSPVSPTASGDLAASSCATSTSMSVYQTVMPGSTTTVFSTGQTVVPVYSTSVVPASTVCSANPTTPTTVPSASRTSSDTPETQPTSETTSQPVVIIGGSSSTKILTTTSTFIPTPSSTTGGVGESLVSPAAGAVSSTKSQEMVLSTSFLTLVFTTTDNAGHASTYASAVPTLLNVPKHNAASTNKGAIAGGVVGGIAALVLAVLAFLLMKKRGLFRRGDDEIEEDAWAPPAHGEYYGTASGRNRTTTGATLVGAGGTGGGSDDEKYGGGGNDREVDAATLERHQSWYAGGGAGGRTMEEIYHESVHQQFGTRSSSPQGYPGAAEAIGAAALGAGGGLATRSASNRLSIYSANGAGGGGSSQGHSQEYPSSPPYPQQLQLPHIPDHRLSGFNYYPNYAQPEIYRPASPPQQRPRSASPTSPNHHYDLSNYASRSNTLPHRSASNGLALPPHLRNLENQHRSRPSLGAIQSTSNDPSSSTTTSSSPSRGETSDSLPTTDLQHSNSYGSTSNKPYSLPQLDRLKVTRPAFERAASTESFVAPTQWLGAKIANADSESESGLESKEDLTEKLQDFPHSLDDNPQIRA